MSADPLFENDYITSPRSPPLKAITFNYNTKDTTLHSTSTSSSEDDSDVDNNCHNQGNRKRQREPAQADAVLVNFLGNNNHPDLASAAGTRPLGGEDAEDATSGGSDGEMGGGGYGQPTTDLKRVASEALTSNELSHNGAHQRHGSNGPHLWPIDTTAQNGDSHRSAHQSGAPASYIHSSIYTSAIFPKPNLPGVDQNLSQSRPSSSQTAIRSPRDDGGSLATSPALRESMIRTAERSSTETLPAMHGSPIMSAKSPGSSQNLPSLQSQLGNLKDAPPPPGHRLSFSNGSIHSPPADMNPIRQSPYGHSLQSRSVGSYPNYPPNEPSPASTNSAVSPRDFRPGAGIRSMSPPSKFGPRQYQTSSLTPQSDVQTPLSAASTQSALRNLSSDSSPVADGLIDDRPILPPPINGNGTSINGAFRCDHPGCNAPPFQTQYLLNSHANVHSQNRPHYCPVKTCNRSEGGKGFKRKNEMIRHGLVHQSPGYICPFCPEREHKYPRPDNLQRHVRVHHVDKDKDDPKLREVLSQRPEGGSRGRRRRVNS